MVGGVSNRFSFMPPRAVVFDAYGTLFDVYSVGLAAEQMFPGHGERLAALWRDKQIEATRLVSMAGRYQPFWALTRAGLRWAAARLGLKLDAEGEERLMNQYRHLSPFPENREVLQALQARGVPAAIIATGAPEMLAVAVKSAGFTDLLQHVISVHPVACFKPDPRVYALAPATLGCAARDILFVSSNGWDALGATWYGFTTLWVNRAGLPPEPLDPPPTRTGTSLRDVLSFFA